MKKILLFLFCFGVSVLLLISCNEKLERSMPSDKDEKNNLYADSANAEKLPEGSGVMWRYNITLKQKPYITISLSDWIAVIEHCTGAQTEEDPYVFGMADRYWSPDATPPTREELCDCSYVYAYIPENYAELWRPDLVLPLDPYSTVVFNGTIFWSNVNLHHTVYDFVESNDTSERSFLLLFSEEPQRCLENGDVDTYVDCDTAVSTWCRDFLPDAEPVEGTNFVLWTGTVEEMLSIVADYGKQIWVCFPEDFVDIYGFTIKQAQVLISKGYLDMWCYATSISPLYGLTPTEIAAYIAEHPEILEE